MLPMAGRLLVRVRDGATQDSINERRPLLHRSDHTNLPVYFRRGFGEGERVPNDSQFVSRTDARLLSPSGRKGKITWQIIQRSSVRTRITPQATSWVDTTLVIFSPRTPPVNPPKS